MIISIQLTVDGILHTSKYMQMDFHLYFGYLSTFIARKSEVHLITNIFFLMIPLQLLKNEFIIIFTTLWFLFVLFFSFIAETNHEGNSRF